MKSKLIFFGEGNEGEKQYPLLAAQIFSKDLQPKRSSCKEIDYSALEDIQLFPVKFTFPYKLYTLLILDEIQLMLTIRFKTVKLVSFT